MEAGGLRPQWAVKAIVIIILGSILFRCVTAANHTVGGPSGWDLTSDLQAWTADTTFHVGDSLGTYAYIHIYIYMCVCVSNIVCMYLY